MTFAIDPLAHQPAILMRIKDLAFSVNNLFEISALDITAEHECEDTMMDTTRNNLIVFKTL